MSERLGQPPADVGCPTATLRVSLRAGFLEKRETWCAPVVLVSKSGCCIAILVALKPPTRPP